MNTNKFKLEFDAKITYKVYNWVCTIATDKRVFPVDLKFKLNNLTRVEFIAFANKVMNLEQENFAYSSKKVRDRQYWGFRNLNEHLIEETPKLTLDAALQKIKDLEKQKEELKIKNLKLEKRVSDAVEYFHYLDNAIDEMMDMVLEAAKETRKGVNIIVK